MRSRLFLLLFYLLSLAPLSYAQPGVINGGLESWRRREFRCCGRNVDLPIDWGTPEQSCGINFNKFVFLEDDPFNVHGGHYSAKLFSDTSFFNNVVLEPGILVYGGYPNALDSEVTIGQPIADKNSGMGIDSTPLGLTFWLKMSHNLPDTFTYTYLFTRWDSVAHVQDTLAYHSQDIPDSQVPMDQWFSVSDSIHYRHTGQADTVRVFFYGGRSGNPALQGSTTWIDDISLDNHYPLLTTGIANVPTKDQLSLYPNPASTFLRVNAGSDSKMHLIEISDDLGRVVSQTIGESAVASVDISHLAVGSYACRVLDSSHNGVYQARFTVVR